MGWKNVSHKSRKNVIVETHLKTEVNFRPSKLMENPALIAPPLHFDWRISKRKDPRLQDCMAGHAHRHALPERFKVFTGHFHFSFESLMERFRDLGGNGSVGAGGSNPRRGQNGGS